MFLSEEFTEQLHAALEQSAVEVTYLDENMQRFAKLVRREAGVKYKKTKKYFTCSNIVDGSVVTIYYANLKAAFFADADMLKQYEGQKRVYEKILEILPGDQAEGLQDLSIHLFNSVLSFLLYQYNTGLVVDLQKILNLLTNYADGVSLDDRKAMFILGVESPAVLADLNICRAQMKKVLEKRIQLEEEIIDQEFETYKEQDPDVSTEERDLVKAHFKEVVDVEFPLIDQDTSLYSIVTRHWPSILAPNEPWLFMKRIN